MIVSSIIGFAPAVFLLFLLLRRYEEFFKGKNIFFFFAIGMVLGMIIIVFQLLTPYTLLVFVILFPIFEELAKLVILNWPKLKGKLETVYYGAGLGLGIGSMAIIAIAFSTFSDYPDTMGNPQTYFDLVLLSFNFSLLHGATGVMIGYGSAKNMIFNFFIKAYILHAIYNLFFFIYSFTEGAMKYGPLLMATLIAIALFYYVLHALMPEALPSEFQRKRRRELRREARLKKRT